jgi:hypothetical protein
MVFQTSADQVPPLKISPLSPSESIKLRGLDGSKGFPEWFRQGEALSLEYTENNSTSLLE